jgi:thiamine pyrophosphokinase
MKPRPALVIANGDVPPFATWKELLLDEPLLICADGGADRLWALGVKPHVIIGDLDSLSTATRNHLQDVKVIKVADQSNTDLEKALDYLLSRPCGPVTALGVTGQRGDHTLANFCILLKYHRRMALSFRDAYADIRVVEGGYEFAAAPGIRVSLLPMEPCAGVTTRGLQWDLDNALLAAGVRESISNRILKNPVQITVHSGRLLLFVDFAPEHSNPV